MNPEQTVNAADRNQVKNSSRMEKFTQIDLLTDLENLMSSKSRRRLMSWILDYCGLDKSSLHQSGSIVYFNEGRKNVAYELQDLLKRNFLDLFHQMEREKSQREELQNV